MQTLKDTATCTVAICLQSWLETRCFSFLPSPWRTERQMSEGHRGFLLLLCCSALFVQMELYDIRNQPTLFPFRTPKEGGKPLTISKRHFFSLPRKYKFICFDLIFSFLSLRILGAIHDCIQTHTHKKKTQPQNLFICYLVHTPRTNSVFA